MKIHNAAGWTIFVFGFLAILLGLVGLIRPEILLSILGFEVIDRATLATVDQGTQEFSSTSPPAIANDGRHIAHIEADGRVCLHEAGARWTVPFKVPPTESMCVFSGNRLLVADV